MKAIYNPQTIERKAFHIAPSSLKVDTARRTITGYASTFDGAPDAYGDIVAPGAFTKTITERGNAIRFLWQHDSSQPIGRLDVLREDQKGLYFEAYISDVQRGNETLTLADDGALDSLSIGYDAVEAPWEKRETPEGQKVVRVLKQIRLWEISVVTFPANENAMMTGVKTVPGFSDLPLADRGRAWDASAAEKRVREYAGGEDNMDWKKYQKAFFWFDGENAEQFTSYKLGYADVIDGKLTAIPRGIFAVAGVLNGARGGTDIPDSEQQKIKSLVTRYYSKMRAQFDDDSIVAPWEDKALKDQSDAPNFRDAIPNTPVRCENCQFALTLGEGKFRCTKYNFVTSAEKVCDGYKAGKSQPKEMTPVGPQQRVGDLLVGAMMSDIMGIGASLLMDGILTSDEVFALVGSCTQCADMMLQSMGADVAGRELGSPMPMFMLGVNRALAQKEGRVLSGRSLAAVQAAIAALQKLLEDAGAISADDEPEQAGDKKPPAQQSDGKAGPVPSTHLDMLRAQAFKQLLDIAKQKEGTA